MPNERKRIRLRGNSGNSQSKKELYNNILQNKCQKSITRGRQNHVSQQVHFTQHHQGQCQHKVFSIMMTNERSILFVNSVLLSTLGYELKNDRVIRNVLNTAIPLLRRKTVVKEIINSIEKQSLSKIFLLDEGESGHMKQALGENCISSVIRSLRTMLKIMMVSTSLLIFTR